MQQYVGVVVQHEDRIALVREQYDTWDREHWNLPSGAVEPGETPPQGAVRELQEETGLQLPLSALTQIWTTTVHHDGRPVNQSFNYTATTSRETFAPNDPDNSVLEVRWFSVTEAITHLTALPYPPISVPAVAYLTDAMPAAWSFNLTNNTWTY
ncbi:NUDIX hydrolase [Kribbella sp. DT2]|uniref:NUDIX hydrolase n=1 Tax=Kribbella sp. DT2 TaxID=3393427 RepID=UPI003CE8F4A8